MLETGSNWVKYHFDFRYFVLYYLPELRFLDSRPVTNEELDTAITKGEFTKVVRPVSILIVYIGVMEIAIVKVLSILENINHLFKYISNTVNGNVNVY